MSELSDAIFGQSTAKKPPQKKPRVVSGPKPAPTKGTVHFGPSLLDQLTGGQGSKVLGHVMNVLDTPFSLMGAAMQDLAAGRLDKSTGKMSRENALAHAMHQIGTGQFDAAQQQHAITSLPAMASMRTGQGPFAQIGKFAQQHPTLFGLGAAASEFANPANALFGDATAVGGDLLKSALRQTARTASRAGYRGAAQVASRAAEGAANRFNDIGAAARTEAERTGANPEAASSQAQHGARLMVTAPKWARGQAQRIVEKLFKGLNSEQQMKLVDYIEGERTIGVPGSKTWKAATADNRKLAQLAQQYRTTMRAVDQQQAQHGLSPARLWQTDTYFPRRGFSLDPNASLDEDVQELIDNNRTRGGVGYRAGTAGQNVHRTYPTLQAARRAGVALNPEWRPSVALERHLTQRLQNVRLSQGLDKLESQGLIEPRDISKRTDYVPFSDVGNVRNFGAPLTRESVVHPSIIRLLNDMAPEVSPAEELGVPSIASALGKGLKGANYLAARFEVSNPAYHPLVNLRPNYFAQGGKIAPLIKNIATGADVPEAEERGAVLPYASDMPMGEQVLPFKERDLKGKVQSLTQKPIEDVTSKALYKHIEPRIGAALYRSLRDSGMSESDAVSSTRAALGEPENLAGSERGAASALIFPGWLKSQARFWAGKLLSNPELYSGPHRAVEARNRSRGLSPKSTDYYQMIPPFVMSKNKGGGYVMGEIPHPANRILGLGALALDAATGNVDSAKVARTLTNVLNPALASAARTVYTAAAPANQPGFGILWDKDAPASEKAKQFLQTGAGSYAPARGGPTGAASALGFGGYVSDAGTPQAKARYKVEQLFRQGYWGHGSADIPGIEDLRRAAKKARQAGDVKRAQKLDSMADHMWYRMQQVLQRLGAQP